MSRKLIILGVCVGLLALAGMAAEEQPKVGGILRVGVHKAIQGLAPYVRYGAGTFALQDNIYDRLLVYSPPNGDIVGELAETWEIPDSTTYIFHLRQGVKFHNGNDFTAEDVKFSLEMILDPDTTASLAPNLSLIASIDVLDTYTVQLNLSSPSASLLAVLASAEAQIVDKEWAEAGHDFFQEMNGTGPFKYVGGDPAVEVKLVRNENYWKEGLPYLDEVRLVPIPEESTRANALKTGEVDFAEYIPWQDMEYFDADSGFDLYWGTGTFNFVRLNPSEPPFDNVLVRQALNYAVDRQELVDLAFGGRGLAKKSGCIFPGTYFYNDDLEIWSYDPDKAVALLKEAGYDNPSELAFTLNSVTLRVHADTAELIQAQLARLGINVELNLMEVPILFDMRVNGGYQATMDGTSFDIFDPDGYSSYFACGATQYANGVGFCDEQLDDLLNQGRQEVDAVKRRAVYHDFEERLLELSPWMFLYFRPQGEAMANYVRGYVRLPGSIGTMSTEFMENLWLDK